MGGGLSFVLQQLAMWIKYFPSPFCGNLFLLFGLVPITVILTIGVSWGTYRLCCQDLTKVLKLYRTPRAGDRAMDDKPFRKFLAQSMRRWYYHMLSSISIVL